MNIFLGGNVIAEPYQWPLITQGTDGHTDRQRPLSTHLRRVAYRRGLVALQHVMAEERTRFAGLVQGIDGRVVAQLVWLD